MTRPVITNLPPFPVRGEDPATFAAKANDTVAAYPAFVTETNAVAAFVESEADSAAIDAATASSAATTATAAAAAAEAASNAEEWTSGETYQAGDVVWSPITFFSYRANTTTSGTTDPSLSADWVLLAIEQPAVRQPIITSPADSATDVLFTPTIEGTEYAPLYSVDPRDYRQLQIDLAAGDFSSPVVDQQEDADDITVTTPLTLNTAYKARIRDVSTTSAESAWSDEVSFTTADIAINEPTLTVEGSPDDVPEQPELTTSAFSTTPPDEDTHAATDWEVRKTSDNSLVYSSLNDTVNLLTITVPAGNLEEDTEYLFRARHVGTTYGAGPFAEVIARTVATFVGPIGIAGQQGFGVGVYPDTLPSGFSTLTGTADPASANYGNYQYTDGSIMVFIPKFYYRIGSSSSPNFATYGANAIDIADSSVFSTTAAANGAGYALHRAFIDGGSEKLGFFIDKYLCSKNAGNDAGRSVQNAVPISLTTSTNYTRSDGMTGCTGILADAVVLSRARGSGFNVATIFMYSAAALLSLAHGQAATSDTHCAWFDSGGVTNFPKGCNNNALGDVDDATLTFTTAGDSGSANKPLTGSANNLAKTAHNGQASGVVDINGAMWEVALGITYPGTSGTDSTAQISNTTGHILKESIAFSSLTAGWNTGTDAWGNTTHIDGLYDSVTSYYWWTATTTTKFGDGTNQVFSEATSGADWLKTAGGVAETSSGMSPGGTNLFGVDSNFASRTSNMFPLVGGSWSIAAVAGVFARNWNNRRSGVGSGDGFRAAAFGN